MSVIANEPLQVAVLGYGMAGSVFHAPLVAATPGMRMSAVVTGNEQRAAQARATYPGVRVFADAEQVFSAGDVDLVVIATPNRSHAGLARAAIDAGLPVLVDKPFATAAAEAQSVFDAAVSAGVPLTVFQNRRWDGDFLTLRGLVEAGELGAISRFESRFERWRPAPKPGWRESGSPEDAGGLLFDLGAHLVDQALQLFGPVHAVYAQVDHRRPQVRTDDDVFVALSHASGVRSHLWASAVASSLGPRFRALGDRAAYVVYGLDPQEDALRAGRRPDTEVAWGTAPASTWGRVGVPGEARVVETRAGCYQDFYAAVAAALRGEGALPVDARDSIECLRIIEAARRSSESGVVVEL